MEKLDLDSPREPRWLNRSMPLNYADVTNALIKINMRSNFIMSHEQFKLFKSKELGQNWSTWVFKYE